MVAAEAIKGIYNIVLLSSGAPGITLWSKYRKMLEINIICKFKGLGVKKVALFVQIEENIGKIT